MTVRHFLTLADFPPAEVLEIVRRATELKRDPEAADAPPGKILGMVFEKPSTRTRAAFDVAMAQLGGGASLLTAADSQLGRGEPVEDSARVLSRMFDCVAMRTADHGRLERFAACSRVPVINALSDGFHPCQLLADMQTYREHRGDIAGRRVAWVGDGNNMCRTYIQAAAVFDFELRIACPPGFEPDAGPPAGGGARVVVGHDPAEAVRGADLVSTDVWASMGQERDRERRLARFAGFQVTREMMAAAAPGALFMHCLPAHRGEEVSAGLLDAEDSVVWEQAENRMHSQKALLECLLRR